MIPSFFLVCQFDGPVRIRSLSGSKQRLPGSLNQNMQVIVDQNMQVIILGSVKI